MLAKNMSCEKFYCPMARGTPRAWAFGQVRGCVASPGSYKVPRARSYTCLRRAQFPCLVGVGVTFLALQVVFFTYMIRMHDAASPSVPPSLLPMVQLVAAPAEAEADVESSMTISAVSGELPTLQADSNLLQPHTAGMQPLHGPDGGRTDVNSTATTRSRQSSRQAHVTWDFHAPTHMAGRDVDIHGCLGQGTYGTVLNGSLVSSGQPVVIKVPVLRHWGFKYYRAELRGLSDLQATIGSSRHIVRLIGNTSYDTSELLRLREQTGFECLNKTDLELARSATAQLPALLLEPLATHSLFDWLGTIAAPPSDVASPRPLNAQRRLFRSQLVKARAPSSAYREAFGQASTVLLGAARGLAALHRARIIHRDLTEPGRSATLPSPLRMRAMRPRCQCSPFFRPLPCERG